MQFIADLFGGSEENYFHIADDRIVRLPESMSFNVPDVCQKAMREIFHSVWRQLEQEERRMEKCAPPYMFIAFGGVLTSSPCEAGSISRTYFDLKAILNYNENINNDKRTEKSLSLNIGYIDNHTGAYDNNLESCNICNYADGIQDYRMLNFIRLESYISAAWHHMMQGNLDVAEIVDDYVFHPIQPEEPVESIQEQYSELKWAIKAVLATPVPFDQEQWTPRMIATEIRRRQLIVGRSVYSDEIRDILIELRPQFALE